MDSGGLLQRSATRELCRAIFGKRLCVVILTVALRFRMQDTVSISICSDANLKIFHRRTGSRTPFPLPIVGSRYFIIRLERHSISVILDKLRVVKEH